MIKLCPPAIIYLLFSIIQILIDSFSGLYNTALIKIIIMIIITLLLNMLCQNGLGVISWIIVFIPFILMSVVVSILLYVFGLNTTTGTTSYSKIIASDASENIIIYDPDHKFSTKLAYYESPNIIIPKSKIYSENKIHNSQINSRPNSNINNRPPIFSSGNSYRS